MNEQEPKFLLSGTVSPDKYAALQERKMDHDASYRLAALEAGWFGKIFGSKNAASNVAGISVLLGFLGSVVVTGILVYNATNGTSNAFEIWKYTTPIITGGLGFLFGKK
ncbi:MAG: hypothetical protein ABSH38_09340 [Verrucomicrobiota bacterium]|jgi:hypothetical protein